MSFSVTDAQLMLNSFDKHHLIPMKKSILLIFFFIASAAPACAEDLFAELGCGSGCRIEYYTLKGPYTGQDGLRKLLVREVSSTTDIQSGVPQVRMRKQVWILADCDKQKINMSSFSSNGRESHADASAWQDIERDRTYYELGVSNVYDKLCK